MKRCISILGACLGLTALTAQAGPLTLTFLGDGIGSITLPDDTLITTGSLDIKHAPSTPMPAGYDATGRAILFVGTSWYLPVPSGTPWAVAAPDLSDFTRWRISLSYENGFAIGGFFSSFNTGQSNGEVDFGGIGGYDSCCSGVTRSLFSSFGTAARNIGNTWSVTYQNVPVTPTVFLLGLGLVGIGAARRKQA